MVNFKEIYSFFKVPEGVQHFQGGPNCLFPIETRITCDFPGGSGPPVSPPPPALLYWLHSAGISFEGTFMEEIH